MRELTPQAAVELVVDRGLCRFGDRPRATILTGGVSSSVVLVETDHPEQRWVLKQPCPKLKVAQDWQCSIERIWREVEVLEICGKLLAQGYKLSGQEGIRVPEVAFTDRENYVYAMTAAPVDCTPWKELLLGGTFHPQTAQRCGVMLGQLHGHSWQNEEIARRLDDRQFFEQLRVLPYYQYVLEKNQSCQPELARLIENVRENRWSLVHGDFSPKNLLVSPGQATLIDFEVGHYGDPAFDLGFFLTHLVCKAIRHRFRNPRAGDEGNCLPPLELADQFWTAYHETLSACRRDRDPGWQDHFRELEARVVKNLGACLQARVDGKSPLEYLSEEERAIVRGLGGRLLFAPEMGWREAYEEIARTCRTAT